MLAAVAKSAQLGLHGWLSDAMEGPTPVSALIHAATMVTAGVFLIYRCSMILEYAPVVLCLIAFIGAQTALLAASSALVQNDIKKVIALSTRLVIMADRMAIVGSMYLIFVVEIQVNDLQEGSRTLTAMEI